MKKNVKMIDIAQKLGVSKVTVSNALAGRSGVSDQMREKICKTAVEMGYISKNSSEKEIYSVGVLVSAKYVEKGESFYWEVYWEVASRLKTKGLAVAFEMIKIKEEKQKIMPLCLENSKCDAVIIIGKLETDYLQLLQRRFSLPMVILDAYSGDLEIDSVISDGYIGMYQMTNYLLKKGHRNIGFVGSICATSSIMDRYHGYCKALMEKGIQIRKEWILEDRNVETGDIIVGELPDMMPTAFACNCDLVANELIKKLIEKGYGVPDDISVVGYDNYINNNYYNIGITSYEIDISEMVKATVELIIDKLQGNAEEKTELKVLTGRIVEKESVREIPEVFF